MATSEANISKAAITLLGLPFFIFNHGAIHGSTLSENHARCFVSSELYSHPPIQASRLSAQRAPAQAYCSQWKLRPAL